MDYELAHPLGQSVPSTVAGGSVIGLKVLNIQIYEQWNDWTGSNMARNNMTNGRC